MSAAMEAREPSAEYLSTLPLPLVQHFELMATAPGGVARLRELILTLAVQGKLVPQDPKDEPASELLKQIRLEKDRLIADGKIKKDKPIPEIESDEVPFLTPKTWEWVRLGDVSSYIQRGKSPTYADHSAHRVISQKCVRWYGLDVEPARYITADSLSKYEELRFLQAGDLLWNSTGTGTIGRACLVEAQHADARLVADSHVTVVRPIKLISSFLWRWIQSPYVQDEIEGAASGTTNQIELNTSTVVSHLMPLPPLAEQARIVVRVEELMRLCDALEAQGQLEAAQHAQLVQTLLGALTASTSPEELADNWQRVATHFDSLLDRPEAIDALEQTILQLAVRGLLVPQDPKDEPSETFVRRVNQGREIRKAKDSREVLASTESADLPNGWCVTNIGCIADCLDYVRKPIKKSEREATVGTIPYYGANGQVGWIDDYLFDEDLVLVVEDETFIGRKKPFSYIVRGKSWVNNHAHVLRPLPGMTVEYLNLCLERYDFVPLTSGTTNRRKLTKAGLLDAKISVAPIPEQSRIVARVESMRRLCAELRQRLVARQSTQAHLAEALIDEVA